MNLHEGMVERVARGICRAHPHNTDPDTIVETGQYQLGPKGSRLLCAHYQRPAWELFIGEARAAIRAMRAYIDGLPTKADDEIREQVGALAIIDEALK